SRFVRSGMMNIFVFTFIYMYQSLLSAVQYRPRYCISGCLRGFRFLLENIRYLYLLNRYNSWGESVCLLTMIGWIGLQPTVGANLFAQAPHRRQLTQFLHVSSLRAVQFLLKIGATATAIRGLRCPGGPVQKMSV